MDQPRFPLTCVTWTDFQRNPSLLYGLFKTKWMKDCQHDPDQVTVLDPKLADGASGSFYVTSAETLDAVRDVLLSRPLVFLVKCHFTKTQESVFAAKPKLSHDKLVLLVDTADKTVSSAITSGFTKAKELLLQGVTFKFVINFEMSVGKWYPKLFKGKETEEVSSCTGAEITITNQAISGECCHCGSIFCVLCFPVWLLTAPCYLIHRFFSHDDPFVRLDELPVAMRIEVHPGVTAEICKDLKTGEDKIAVSCNTDQGNAKISGEMVLESLANALVRNGKTD